MVGIRKISQLITTSLRKRAEGNPSRHCATVRERTRTGDPPRLVEVVARLSRRHRSPNRRVRWHRPNQINIPPVASDCQLQPCVLVPPAAGIFSSFLLRERIYLCPSRLPFAPIPASIIDRASLLSSSLFLARYARCHSPS